MNRIYNFSAGPSMLPLEVLEQAQKDFVSFQDSGMSVMEMSHRSKRYGEIIAHTEELLRELMEIPNNYKVLFLQGGASTQFAMVPLNLFRHSKKADYVLTGQWAQKAYEEASRYGNARVVASSKESIYSYIPKLDPSTFDPEADYFFITVNNTVYGTHYTKEKIPNTGLVPLVGDISSNILAEKIDVNQFGLLFAGAQKNLGPAGLTVAIVRDDLIGHAMDCTPTMLNYEIHAKNDSMYNTPPTYAIYFAGLVFEWVKKQGGVSVMEQRNREKADILYRFLDESSLFQGTVAREDRSLMNATFILPTDQLNEKFLKEASGKGMIELKGHRSVGGMRASLYNAMPKEGVEELVKLMKKFEMDNK